MDEDKKAVDGGTAAPTNSTLTDDSEARFATLEAEKNKAVEAAANWKIAAMKARAEGSDESEDDKMRRVAGEVLAESRLAEITREQDAIIKKTLKENKELKLAQLNKTGAPPAAQGTHSEGQAVTDTLITPEQMAAFKALKWTEKDIERYKKNLGRYSPGIGGR